MDERPPTTWRELEPPLARPDRRIVVKTALGGGALLAALGPAAAQTADAVLADYRPVFLQPSEWAFVRAACARFIPSDGEGPGAIEAHAPVFIDRDLAGDFGKGADWYMRGPHKPDADPLLGFQSPLSPAQIYREAIVVVDGWCEKEKGKAFAGLDAAAQDDVLRALQTGKIALKPELRDFFGLLLQHTKEGYFSDPRYGGNYRMAGWKHVGFPGARGSFREWANADGRPYPLGPVSISGERG